MRRIRLVVLSFGLLVLALCASPAAFAASSNTVAINNASQAGWRTGVVASGGKIHPVPTNARYMPDPNATYKVVFAVTRGSDDPSKIGAGLERVARAVNLYTSAGVPLDHLQFVAVVYGAATPLALDDAHYEDEFLVKNPNLPVIRELRKAGVDIVVCGQAMAEYKYNFEWADRDVPIALSGVTTITELELKGYALMQF